MTDEQYGGIGCLTILLIIGGCYLHYSHKEDKLDANRMMDELVQKVEQETAEKITVLRNDYEQKRIEREEGFQQESARLLNQMQTEQRRINAEKRIVKEKDLKDEDLRSFALKESPDIWKTVQHLKAEIESLSKRIKELEYTLRRFNKDPKADDDVVRMSDFKMQLESQLSMVIDKLEAAYLASKKYEAMPHRADFNELMQKSLEDGISAAELAEQRYTELKEKEK